MRILILGAGGIGGFYGARLIESGADVTFLVRPRRAAQLAERGLVVRSPDRVFETRVSTLAADQVTSPFDVIILSCKSFDLDSALDAIAPAVGPDTAILPLLNGMRHLDVLIDRFGAARVLGGCASVSVTLSPEGEILQMIDLEQIAFGELDSRLSPRIEMLAAIFAKAKVNSAARTDIMQAMWDKWVSLAGLGAVLTIVRANVGELLEAATGVRFLEAGFAECSAIATAEGYPPSAQLRAMAAQLSKWRGSPFTTSMTRDLMAGAATEAEHIIGDLVRRGEAHGIDQPILRTALTNLQVHEAKRQKTTSKEAK